MKATKQDLMTLDRLQKRSDFLRLNDGADKWVSKAFILLSKENELGKARFGITVTKKLDKRAVGRNRIKRRLRAVAADILPHNAKAGRDYIFIARADAASREYDDLKKDLKWCLGKLGHAV